MAHTPISEEEGDRKLATLSMRHWTLSWWLPNCVSKTTAGNRRSVLVCRLNVNTPGGSYRALQERPVYSVIFRDLVEPSADPIRVASIPEVIVGTSEKGPAYKGRVEIEDIVEVLSIQVSIVDR